jgi:GNAT superfamily N-acetyltransferase
VAREIRSVGEEISELEWKVYSHDGTPDLPEELRAAGFVPQPLEVLMAIALDEARPEALPPPGVEIRRVTDAGGLEHAVAVDAAAFGRDSEFLRHRIGPRLGDPAVGLFVGYLDGSPVSTGRVDLMHGRSFAGLWGGGTIPSARHRGVYRALVGARARLARERGFRYLYVEAFADTSRPVLERLGFVPLSTVVGWLWIRTRR